MAVPVFHSSSPPAGELAAIFTYTPANEWNEDWVGLDLVEARRIGGSLLRAFTKLGGLPIAGL